MALNKRRNTDILLGAFVCFGVLLFGLFIFLIGKENRLFDRSAHVDAYFNNVVGLSVGADVMLAGVLVGYVDRIGFPGFDEQNPSMAGKIKVVMRIPQEKLPWVRQDSVARIDGKGLLGDKIINITLGTPEVAQIGDGGVLRSIESIDLSDALAKAQDVLTHVTGAVKAAKDFIEGFISKGGDTALAEAAGSIRDLARQIEVGDGLVHRLIYSKQSGDSFEDALVNMNSIIKNTKEGQGTLGRLLVDPSIYDDLKLILGNVERNRVLKTLVRFSLQDSKL